MIVQMQGPFDAIIISRYPSKIILHLPFVSAAQLVNVITPIVIEVGLLLFLLAPTAFRALGASAALLFVFRVQVVAISIIPIAFAVQVVIVLIPAIFEVLAFPFILVEIAFVILAISISLILFVVLAALATSAIQLISLPLVSIDAEAPVVFIAQLIAVQFVIALIISLVIHLLVPFASRVLQLNVVIVLL
jgi:hypothetical protein